MKFHPPIVALIAVGSSSSFTAGFVILPSSHRSPWPHSSSSQLNYYKSDEPFAERLSRSISPELLNEINAAQKALVAQVKYADKYAESIMKRGHREEAKIIKKVLSGLQSREGALVSEMKEVKLEYDEVKAAKLLGEAVEETVRSDLMVERDLMVVTERVASVLREAEAALKSVPVALGIGGDDNDDDVRENFVARLESTSHDLEQSIQTANAIASAAKKVALKDAKILDRLQEVGSDLSDAMEDTQNTIAFINEQQGEGVVDNDLVESARGVEMVASEVIKELLAVEKLADVVANKVDIEADAVLAISTSSADTLDNAIRAVKQQSKSDTNPDILQSKLSNYADKIAKEERDASALADAIKSDSINDEAALQLVNSADKEITSMVNGVGDLVEEAARNIIKVDNEELLPDEEEAESIESAAKELLEDISNIEDATEKSEESAVKRLEESIKARREKEEAEEMERRNEEEETKAESNEEHENAGESSSDEGKFEEEEESSSEESEDEGSSRQKDESSSEENSEANEEEESIESTTKEDEGESDTTNEENVSNEKESAEAETGSDEDVASSVEEEDNEESSADDNHDAGNSSTTSDHEADTEEVSNDLGDTNNSDDLEGVVAKASAESSTTESLEDVSEMSGSADEETLLASSGSEEVADVARNALEEDFDVAKDVTALEAPIGDDLLASSSGSDELDGIISSTSDMADGATLLASSEDATSTLESVHEIAKSAATEAIDTVHVLADVVATSLFL
mmetsp:Transcript_22475/g.48939  ORF Transcript_22475/g.48939 Transcript_22475/m.48939 type:complete len:754 (-) Transcript_22475:94-2355(-)